MPKEERLINASAAVAGSAIAYLQGASNFSLRLGCTAGTFTYEVRATLTPNESIATGHLVVAEVTGASGSVLIEMTDKQYYAILVKYSAMSGGGTMSVFMNTGEIEK